MLQQGYAFGYLLATVFARGLVDTTSHGWRPLFWFGACPPVLIIIFRLCLPETQTFLKRQELKLQRAEGVDDIHKVVMKEAKVGLKKHWPLLIYMVLLMAGFNFMVSRIYLPSPPVQIWAELMVCGNSRMDRRICTRPCWKTSSSLALTRSRLRK